MVKVITMYQCTICASEYSDLKLAELCEGAAELATCPVKIGDHVKVYERYGEPQDDVVVDISIGPDFLNHLLQDYDHYIRCIKGGGEICFHKHMITVKNYHQMGKDGDSYTKTVSLGDIMVDGKWLENRGDE
jgi:hypothetical protein